MTKPQVLFLGGLNKDLPEYKAFAESFECIDYKITSKEQLLEDFTTKLKDISAIYGAWLGFIPVGGFKNEIIENCPANLKVISICSVGYDQYDERRMAEKNIILTNVPSIGSADPVADLVLYKALASFRNFNIAQKICHEIPNTIKARAQLQYGEFDHETGKTILGPDNLFAYGETTAGLQNLNPKGHNVVVVGFGQIGRLIGSRLHNIGMNIHYIKRSPLTKEEEASLGYKATFQKSLKDVTDIADLVVIAAPGNADTKHMINESVINLFNKQFRLINVGRGSIIDEQALVKGLKSGKVLFAGLDVFETEPAVNKELLNREDVMVTPHIGASTVENFDLTAVEAMKNIQNVLLDHGEGLTRVN